MYLRFKSNLMEGLACLTVPAVALARASINSGGGLPQDRIGLTTDVLQEEQCSVFLHSLTAPHLSVNVILYPIQPQQGLS